MSLYQLHGPPCLQHPSYVFYKSFTYKCNNGSRRILTCGDFFLAQVTDSSPVCVGEVELVWKDVASNLLLVSVKFYFRPEHTPDGRQDETGEDEVIALGERLVVRLDELLPRIHHDIKWTYGSCADSSRADLVAAGCERNRAACEVVRNNQAVHHENGKKRNFGVDISEKGNTDSVCDSACCGAANVLVLTYPKYCRYRAMQKRLEGSENEWLHLAAVAAIGGLSGKSPRCRVMFCRETFSQVEYEELGIRMDHMNFYLVLLTCPSTVPTLKEPTKGKKSRQASQKDSQQDSDSMEENSSQVTHPVSTSSRPRRSVESSDMNEEKVSTAEQAFLIGLHKFMHDAQMPIGRIPSLGFKQIDLYFFYKQAEKLGGYDMITEKRMWKRLYDQLGGNSSNTSAATCTRKHYERLLLPYERHLRKQTVTKTKKKPKKPVEAEADIKHETADDCLETDDKQEHDSPHSEVEAKSMESGEVVLATPAAEEYSEPDLEEKLEKQEMAAETNNCQDVAEAAVAEDSDNIEHMTVTDTQPVHHHPPPSTAEVTAAPSIPLAGEKPALSYANLMCSGGYILPAQSSHVLLATWPVVTPVVSTSPAPSSSTPALVDVILPLQNVRASLPQAMPSSSKNHKSVPSAVPSLDSCSQSVPTPAAACQTRQPSSPTDRRVQRAAYKDIDYQTTSVHVSQIKPALILPPSQQLSQNLSVSSHHLASLLHPTPAGHQHLRHLPPAPSSIYLHPSSVNHLSLLQAPTFPAQAAHCQSRKRAYPFDSCIAAAPGGTFPSPDIVLDRIRNSTSFPGSSRTLAKPPSIRQKFDDPRDIFRQIPQTVAASHVSSHISSQSSMRKEARLPLEKKFCSKLNSSAKHSQQQLRQPENSVSSCDSKVMHSMKAASHTNGFISPPRSSKSTTSMSLCQSPAATNNGQLTSVLFGSQFTALPRIAKPSDFSCQSTSMLDSSLPTTTAMTLSAHLHPAFVSPFLQATSPAASPSISPGLHLLAGTYTSPLQLSAYEEMLRQNGYSRFLTASTQRKAFQKK